MANHSKREKRRQHVIEALDATPVSRTELPRCKVCGAEGRFEVYKGPTYIRRYCLSGTFATSCKAWATCQNAKSGGNM